MLQINIALLAADAWRVNAVRINNGFSFAMIAISVYLALRLWDDWQRSNKTADLSKTYGRILEVTEIGFSSLVAVVIQETTVWIFRLLIASNTRNLAQFRR